MTGSLSTITTEAILALPADVRNSLLQAYVETMTDDEQFELVRELLKKVIREPAKIYDYLVFHFHGTLDLSKMDDLWKDMHRQNIRCEIIYAGKLKYIANHELWKDPDAPYQTSGFLVHRPFSAPEDAPFTVHPDARPIYDYFSEQPRIDQGECVIVKYDGVSKTKSLFFSILHHLLQWQASHQREWDSIASINIRGKRHPNIPEVQSKSYRILSFK